MLQSSKCLKDTAESRGRGNAGRQTACNAHPTMSAAVDFERMERFAAVLSLVDDCARAWHAVGQSEMSPLGDPSLRYRKQEALEATTALKDAIRALQDQPASQP